MRLFVALALPGQLRRELAILAGGIPGARWVAPENYHLTLRFIGEQPAHRAQEIDETLGLLRGRGFRLILSGIGTFAKAGRTTALWVGAERTEALERLRAKIETALQRLGLEPERRRFNPHVTLARLDGMAEPRLAGYIQAHNLFRAEVDVARFTLFSSRPGKDQPVYTPEVEYALDAALPRPPV
ncbi:MAG: RNA 2',3'-cyclic phosphodiesterase [Acetobacteraceae bacterium]